MEFFSFIFIAMAFNLSAGSSVVNSEILEFNSKSAPLAMTLMPNVDNLTQLTSHPTIQDAINNANPGDILQLNAGSYSENGNYQKPHITGCYLR